MIKEIHVKNQQAINGFFEAFGTTTAKEYSGALVDVLIMLGANQDLAPEYREDLSSKLKDLNGLILQLTSLINLTAHDGQVCCEN